MQRDLHRVAGSVLTGRAPRAAGSTTRARARCRPTRTSPRRSRPRAMSSARVGVVGRAPGRSRRRARRSSVGSTNSAASPATSGIEPARAATTGTSGAHRLEEREAEALVDRRVREHRRRVEERAPAGVVDVTGEHDAVAHAVRQPRDRGVDGGTGRAVAAGDDEPEIGVRARRARRTRSRGAEGSCAARAWRSRARTESRRSPRRPSAGIRASLPSAGAPSGITTRRPARAQARPEELLDLGRDELRARVNGRAAARSPGARCGTSARTSGVHSSGYRTNEQS